jgi:hypothetical protein
VKIELELSVAEARKLVEALSGPSTTPSSAGASNASNSSNGGLAPRSQEPAGLSAGLEMCLPCLFLIGSSSRCRPAI